MHADAIRADTIRADTVRADTARYLEALLASDFVRGLPQPLLGLACECDPGIGSLYVYLSVDADDVAKAPDFWRYTYVEQDVAGLTEPPWIAEYTKLNEATEHFDGERVASAFAQILRGVSAAIAELKRSGKLAELGFADHPRLGVWCEDDDDEHQGFERVRAALEGAQ